MKRFASLVSAVGALAILLSSLLTAQDEGKKKADEKDIAYVICAEDNTENRIKRMLGKDDVICTKGHVLTKVMCPRDKVVNNLRDENGRLNTQCGKDGASIIILPQDKGPDRIEKAVLKTYPKIQQDRYPLFVKNCSKCHTTARALNADFDARKWQKYVKKMVDTPGSGITVSQGKRIYRFLKFRSGLKKVGKKR